jgi:hypothetical protein
MLKDAQYKPELTCNLLYPNNNDLALSVNPVSAEAKVRLFQKFAFCHVYDHL